MVPDLKHPVSLHLKHPEAILVGSHRRSKRPPAQLLPAPAASMAGTRPRLNRKLVRHRLGTVPVHFSVAAG